jgi:hypothetical protein
VERHEAWTVIVNMISTIDSGLHTTDIWVGY